MALVIEDHADSLAALALAPSEFDIIQEYIPKDSDVEYKKLQPDIVKVQLKSVKDNIQYIRFSKYKFGFDDKTIYNIKLYIGMCTKSLAYNSFTDMLDWVKNHDLEHVLHEMIRIQKEFVFKENILVKQRETELDILAL